MTKPCPQCHEQTDKYRNEPNLNKIQYGMNSTCRDIKKARKKGRRVVDVLRIPYPQVISK